MSVATETLDGISTVLIRKEDKRPKKNKDSWAWQLLNLITGGQWGKMEGHRPNDPAAPGTEFSDAMLKKEADIIGIGDLKALLTGENFSGEKLSDIEKALPFLPFGKVAGIFFKGKTFLQIDKMFTKAGFIKKGPNPLQGQGMYINPKTGTKYYFDRGGTYLKGNEGPHVDVWLNGSSPKYKFFLD